jgi:hypothetical protein
MLRKNIKGHRDTHDDGSPIVASDGKKRCLVN